MTKKPQEVIEIETAVAKWETARMWEKNITVAFWLMYFIGFGIWIIGTFEQASPILLLSAILFIVNLVASYFESKRKWAAINLFTTFHRKQVLPFYQDLVEKFSDHPNLHIHLDDNGMIHIHDKSKGKKDGK